MKGSFEHKGVMFDIVKSNIGYKAVEHKTQLGLPGCNGIKRKSDVRETVAKACSKFNKKKLLEIVKQGVKQLKWKEYFTSKQTMAKFEVMFGISLLQFRDTTMYFMLGRYSFDVIGFDKWLKTPDGISTSDYVTKRFGVEACKFVRQLIKEDIKDVYNGVHVS